MDPRKGINTMTKAKTILLVWSRNCLWIRSTMANIHNTKGNKKIRRMIKISVAPRFPKNNSDMIWWFFKAITKF